MSPDTDKLALGGTKLPWLKTTVTEGAKIRKVKKDCPWTLESGTMSREEREGKLFIFIINSVLIVLLSYVGIGLRNINV